MTEKIDMYSLAKFGLNLAETKTSNIIGAEMFFSNSKYINIEIEENSIKNSEIGSGSGASIRIISHEGSLGFAFTNKLQKKSIEWMVNIAIKMMKAGTPDLDFKDLPKLQLKYPEVNGLFDDNIKNLEIEQVIRYTEDLINVCQEDSLAISQTAECSSSYGKSYIINTNGLEISGKDTSISISSNIIVKDDVSKETSFGYEWQSERSLSKIKAANIAGNALSNAKRNLNRKKIRKMKVPMILTPKGTISLILSPIASAINAETFQYKRSFLVGKRDTIIGSNLLNIEDNALVNGAVGSSIFDGEGVPCKNKKIIEKGKFLSSGLLHNSYTAGKEGIESTGNAARGSYGSIPSIGISNFILKPGEISMSEMIRDVKEGILLEYTGDSPNITTGDFSGLILQGNLIKNGEVKEPLNETMFGIHLIDLFKNIEAVSKEFTVYGAFKAPYVKISDVQIIGSAN